MLPKVRQNSFRGILSLFGYNVLWKKFYGASVAAKRQELNDVVGKLFHLAFCAHLLHHNP